MRTSVRIPRIASQAAREKISQIFAPRKKVNIDISNILLSFNRQVIEINTTANLLCAISREEKRKNKRRKIINPIKIEQLISICSLPPGRYKRVMRDVDSKYKCMCKSCKMLYKRKINKTFHSFVPRLEAIVE